MNKEVTVALGWIRSYPEEARNESRARLLKTLKGPLKMNSHQASQVIVLLSEMLKIYNPLKLTDGINILNNGEEIYYISNPALGLWAWKERFINS